MSARTFSVFSDGDVLARSVAQMTLEKVLAGLEVKSTFHLALTGGVSGNLHSLYLAQGINEEPDRFSGLHIWWGDERFLPVTSQERNDFSLRTHIAAQSPIHFHPVLGPDEVPTVEVAGRRYNADLYGIEMDLTILGVGPDGHVASLFPGMWNKRESGDAIGIDDSPKPPAQRVSFTMSKINRSQNLWLLAAGESKTWVVSQIKQENLDLPVNHARGRDETVIFVDNESAPRD